MATSHASGEAPLYVGWNCSASDMKAPSVTQTDLCPFILLHEVHKALSQPLLQSRGSQSGFPAPAPHPFLGPGENAVFELCSGLPELRVGGVEPSSLYCFLHLVMFEIHWGCAFFSPQWSMGFVLGFLFFFPPPAGFIQNCALNYYFVSYRWRFFVSTHVSEYLWTDTNFLIFTIVFKHYLQLIP